MFNPSKHKQPLLHIFHAPCRKVRYPCKTRQGISAAAVTAWHKRGFESLTCKEIFVTCCRFIHCCGESQEHLYLLFNLNIIKFMPLLIRSAHTFFMSKAKYGKRMIN